MEGGAGEGGGVVGGVSEGWLAPVRLVGPGGVGSLTCLVASEKGLGLGVGFSACDSSWTRPGIWARVIMIKVVLSLA